MHLKDCPEEVMFDCECRHLSKGTLVNYRAQISFLIAYLADRGITDADDVKSQHIRSFLKTKQDQGCKPHYINDLLKAHKMFLSIRGKPLTGEVIARMLKDTAREVGVSQSIRVSPHTCRHTFAHMQLKNGLDVYSLSRLMGHVNISITQRYLQGIKDSDILKRSQRTSPLMNL